MRIINSKITVRSVLFSRIMSVVYFLLFIFFIYRCLLLLPIWLTTKVKATDARIDYEKKVALILEKEDEFESNQTQLGKERYQKFFFNKLDDGEHMIVLYTEVASVEKLNKAERKMFWWEQVEQNIIVWWRNLDML